MLTVFLGILLDGQNYLLALPDEKIAKAKMWLEVTLDHKKIKVKDVQKLMGLLNFLNKAIVLRRAFTRCMYAKISGKTKNLQLHHHIYLDKEFRADCLIWLKLLKEENLAVIYRSVLDQEELTIAQDVDFYIDSLANEKLGFGGIFGTKWFFGQ